MPSFKLHTLMPPCARAEVHFPEEEGIIQIENFGIHINDEVGARSDRLLHLKP
jgi:hypothetical protein